jgi:hypothetical protein
MHCPIIRAVEAELLDASGKKRGQSRAQSLDVALVTSSDTPGVRWGYPLTRARPVYREVPISFNHISGYPEKSTGSSGEGARDAPTYEYGEYYHVPIHTLVG